MKIKELRSILKDGKVQWTIPADIADETEVEAISQPFTLGALYAGYPHPLGREAS